MDRNKEKEIIKFIDRLYRDLYMSDEVLHHSTGNKTDKLRNIKEYLEALRELHERATLTETRKQLLKKMYHERYVIKKEDIPDSYYQLQEQIALERGFGHVRTTESAKKQMQQEVIDNQEKSLDAWLDYFLSDDAKVYPFWAKYWAFQGMLKLGTINKEKGVYNRRTKETVAPFADLNREALSLSIDMIIKSLNKESIDDKQLEEIVKSGSFQRIYTYILNTVLKSNNNISKRNEGRWIKYEQGTDHMPLVKSLQGYNTGWCTAGESTAKIQLAGGDFYVFYTLDDNNEYKVPRIAIRMDGNRIGEIRGVAKGQNLEPEMERIVAEKIKEFPDKDAYYKKVNDMNRLTEIYNKQQAGVDLTREELAFLYEIETNIEGFGYRKDPRIEETKKARNLPKDLSKIFNCEEQYIASDISEINSKTVIYYGRDLDLTDPKNPIIPIPKIVFSDIIYNGRENPKQIQLPEIINGSLVMYCVENIDNMVFPKKVGGALYLRDVTSAKNTIFPDMVTGALILQDLKNGDGLVLPKHLGYHLQLNQLVSANGLKMPDIVKGDIRMDSIQQLDNLTFPKTVGGEVILEDLISASHVVFPEVVEKHLYLRSLENASEVVLPNKVTGSVRLDNLKVADGITFPNNINGHLILDSLEEANNLVLPKIIGGTLCMDGLKIAQNIVFPRRVQEMTLKNLQVANCLILPDVVDGAIYLPQLTYFNIIKFPKTVGKLYLNSLTRVNGLQLPEVVQELNLENLRNADGMVFPKVIEGELNLSNIESIEGAILPEKVGSIIVNRNNGIEIFHDFDKLREALKKKQH